MEAVEELLDSINNSGEHKIYFSKKACIFIIMKMHEDESIIKVGTVKTVVIETSSTMLMIIPFYCRCQRHWILHRRP